MKKSKKTYISTCLIYAFFRNSRFARNIWAQKRSRTPCFSMISSMTSFCASIAFRMCSIFISAQLERTSLTKPPFVRRLGFRFWNLSFNPPFKFFQVWLTDWSSTMQSGLFTGPPLVLQVLSVKSVMVVRSFTLPAQARLGSHTFPRQQLHTQIKFDLKSLLYTSECFTHQNPSLCNCGFLVSNFWEYIM